MDSLDAAVQARRIVGLDLPLIFDAEAVVSLRDINQREYSGETLTAADNARTIDADLALVKEADLVLSGSPREVEFFR